MKTRKQLLNNECTHSQYYSQFIHYGFINRVVQTIGGENLKRSTSPNFNDIDLKYWEKIQSPIGTNQKMKELGDYLTLSGQICIAKEAARNYLLNKYEF